MRRKQSRQHFDQRQLLLLENAYYQVRRDPAQSWLHTHSIVFLSAIPLSA